MYSKLIAIASNLIEFKNKLIKQKMKTTSNITNKIVKAGAVIILTLSAFIIKANTLDEIAAEETEKTIKQHVKFPQLILPVSKTEKVEIVFTTAENGKVDFVLVKSENEILKKELEKQFLALTLPKLKSNVAYSIVFNFKTI